MNPETPIHAQKKIFQSFIYNHEMHKINFKKKRKKEKHYWNSDSDREMRTLQGQLSR